MRGILQKQRSRKRRKDQLQEALDSIADYELTEVCNLQDERLVEVILLSKFQPDDLLTISYLVSQLPATLPISLTESIVGEVVTSAPLNVSRAEANTLYRIFLKFPGLLMSRQPKTAPHLLFNCKSPLFLVLVPPCSACLGCDGRLSLSSSPSNVTIFTLEDAIPGIKIALKCQRCNIRYGYALYGDTTNGYKFYDNPRTFVEASTRTYLHRKLCLSKIFLA